MPSIFGRPDVEDHRVIGLGLAEEMPLFAIEGAIDDIAGVGQRGDELAIEIGIVFNDEEPQGRPPARHESICAAATWPTACPH